MSKRYYYYHAGHKRSVTADSKKEADEKIKEKTRLLDKRVPTSRMLLSDWAEICVETYKPTLDHAGQNHLRYIIRHYITEKLDAPIGNITPIQLQQVMNSMNGYALTTINYVYDSLKFLFKYALVNELVDKDPTAALIKPKGKKGKRRALTPEERGMVLDVAKTDRRYYPFLLMMLCGCSPKEAYSVKRSNVSLKTIKGKTIPVLHIRGTKNAYRDRLVPMPMELYHLVEKIAENDYIGVSKAGNRIESNAKRNWRYFKYAINKKYGAKFYRNSVVEPVFGEGISPYCLRHEYCTELARQGVDIRVAQKLMGHASIRMTAEVYTNLDDDEILLTFA